MTVLSTPPSTSWHGVWCGEPFKVDLGYYSIPRENDPDKRWGQRPCEPEHICIEGFRTGIVTASSGAREALLLLQFFCPPP